MFRRTTRAQPTHMTHITHTWGEVQLRRVAWDFVCPNSHLYCLGKWATASSLSQNLFWQLQAKGEWLTILKSLKRKTNVLLQAQTIKQGCSYKLKQPNKGALMSLKGYISVVSIWGSCLKLLQVVLVFHLHLYLF